MALPESGVISMDDIRKELGVGVISLNDTDVRNLAEKTSGTISLSDFYGKSSNLMKASFKCANVNVIEPGTPQAPLLLTGFANIPKTTPFYGTIVKDDPKYKLIAFKSLRSVYWNAYEFMLLFLNNIGSVFDNKLLEVTLQNSNDVLLSFKIKYKSMNDGKTAYILDPSENNKLMTIFNFLEKKSGSILDIVIK